MSTQNPILSPEFFNFARCQRPDGSIYGSKGKCRKGSQITDSETKGQAKPEPKPTAKSTAGRKTSDKQGKGGKEKALRVDKIAPVPSRKDLKEMILNLGGTKWNPDEKKVFRQVVSARETKELGRIIRKLEDKYMEDDLGNVSIGLIRSMKREMKAWLEANQRSGVGSAAEKRKEGMTPEERRRANTAEAIQRGIRAGVVRAR